jgi:phage-related minor tail protein
MRNHLKDNHGDVHLVPALIIGAIVAVILFIGLICLFKDINPWIAITDFFKSLWYNIKQLINPSPTI